MKVNKKQHPDIKHMKKYKKLLLLLIALIVVCNILLTIFIGYLPIFGKFIAKSKINEYSNVGYDISYDVHSGKYISDDRNIKYNLKNNIIEDLNLIENERIDFNNTYHNYLSDVSKSYDEKISFPSDIDLWIKLDANNTKNKYYKVYLVTVYDNYSGSEEQVNKRINNILSDFLNYMSSYYNITSLQFRYANKDSAFQLSLDCKKDLIDLSELNKYLKEDNKILESDEYIEWKK